MEQRRLILFKGKTISDKWVEGAYFTMHHNDERTHAHHFIIPEDTPIPKNKKIGDIQVEVIAASVGQFTNRLDKNGVKIFEGDLVKVYIPEYWGKDGFFAETEPQEYIGEVKWNKHSLRYEVRFHMDGSGIIGTEFGWSSTDFEVVGNIFDTPELVTKVRPKLFY